jgi:hypothetical protein
MEESPRRLSGGFSRVAKVLWVLACTYGVFLGGTALWALFVDISMRNSGQEHMGPYFILMFLCMPTSLIMFSVIPTTAALLPESPAAVAALTLSGAVQASLLFGLAAIARLSNR